MQSTYSLKIGQVTPARGILLCEPILGQYETDSGIIVVRDMKKNPKIEKMTVIKAGGPFTIHGGRHCNICGEDACRKKERPGKYWAAPGDTIWMKRGFKKLDIEGKTHCFVPNEDIVATLEVVMEDVPDKSIPSYMQASPGKWGIFKAPADMVLVEPIYDGLVEGSKIFVLHDRDKEYAGNFHGIVVAVGPDYKHGLKTGDKIRFRRHEGVKVEVDDRKLISLKAKWVDGVES